MVSYPTSRRRALAALGAGLAVLAASGCASTASAAATPGRPGRIACASGIDELHAALLLGVDPVLAARGPGDAIVADQGYRLDGVPRPDPADGAALAAALAAAAPELVLHAGTAPPSPAPTLAVDPQLDADDQLRRLGAALGRTAEAEQAVAGHRFLTEHTAAIVGASVLAGATVAVLAPGPDGPTVLDAASPAGVALHAAGVGRVTGEAGRADFWLRVSGTPPVPVPADRAAWVGPEFVLDSALVRLARLREIGRVARWFGGVSR